MQKLARCSVPAWPPRAVAPRMAPPFLFSALHATEAAAALFGDSERKDGTKRLSERAPARAHGSVAGLAANPTRSAASARHDDLIRRAGMWETGMLNGPGGIAAIRLPARGAVPWHPRLNPLVRGTDGAETC
jgi:hypothetical protein